MTLLAVRCHAASMSAGASSSPLLGPVMLASIPGQALALWAATPMLRGARRTIWGLYVAQIASLVALAI